MAEIVGTITNLSDFLSKTQVCLSVKPNDPQQQIICLEADRKYSIPAFQREVRWDDNNLKMLLYDLSRSSKFLGNIILTIKSDHTCEIIDGQQRTTVLMLIVSCIKKKFGTKISTPDLCPLRNEGFTGFQTLLEKAFDQEAITSDDWNAILKSDDYHQLPRIQKLWNTISSSELLADRHKAQGLLDNLCKSEFNIIASYSNDVNTSIQYFLDVNLKGIRLDTEDIFKGYLFSQDSRELTRSLWQKNKRDVLRLNGVTQSSEEKRYPLMKLYEHFFYCDLYLPREGDCEYSTLKFGENFCLTSGFESGSTKYYEGSHLIEAIRDRDYLVERYPVQYRDCKAQIAGLLVASEARRLGIDTQSPKLEQIMLQYLSNNDTLLSEDGIKTLNAYALKGYRLITDYPLFDKPTSREEFLDAFNVAMRFYEKKDS